MNKNRKIIISICLLTTLLIAMSINVYAVNNDKDPMLKSADVIRNHINNDEADKKVRIGDVNGEPIYNDELELKYEQAVAMGSDTPYEDAINSIKMLKAEQQFADENNITVTEQEVVEYTNNQRDMVENQVSEELRNGFKAFISELGMSEDEYWTKYKLEENAKYLLHLKVVHYQKEHEISNEDLNNIPVQITNDTYQKDKLDSIIE